MRPTVETRRSRGRWWSFERDGRGLGHAVGDGDLGEVHLGDHALHGLDGARRAGHDAGAQAREVELGKARVVQLGDEHGGHAVQRSAAFLAHGLQRGHGVERLAGNTMVAPVDTQASTASTMPKQWYSGTGMHRLSFSESSWPAR